MIEAPAFSIGRYTVFSQLAEGGQASVHLGRFTAPAGFRRAVAIKRIRADLAKDERARAMMLDEARLASRVQHPNVVQILDVVWHEGELVLVMELVQGESLGRLLRASKGVIPVPVVVAVVAQALRGLHAAHQAIDGEGKPLGLVHRDLSPQNIIVDVHGVAKVLDFGIAKATGRAQEDTEVGTLKGKLSYMAPEQIHGNSAQQSDLWAMGVVLWECLAGTKLFTGESDGAVVGKLLSMPIPSLRDRGVEERLDAVVQRALSRDLSRRFVSAAEMAEALEALAPASAQQVAKWVLATASDAIERTKQRVRELESDISIGTQVKAPAISQVVTTPMPVASRPVAPLVAVAVVAGVAALILGIALRSRETHVEPPIVPVAEVPREPAPPVAPVLEPEAVPPPKPAAEKSPEVLPPEPAVVEKSPEVLSPEPAVEKSPGVRPKPKPKPRTPVTKKPGCEPPFVVVDGVKRWKPECF
jgi:serine/threonine-protein kinase